MLGFCTKDIWLDRLELLFYELSTIAQFDKRILSGVQRLVLDLTEFHILLNYLPAHHLPYSGFSHFRRSTNRVEARSCQRIFGA